MRKVVLLLAFLAVPVWGQIPLPSAPTKYVTDAAGVIPDDRELALNERLAEFERTSTHQVIVYVDRNIPEGTTLEEMGAEAIRTWAVGQVKRDNGAILFLFIDSRDSRIEVGYGIEGTLTDAISKRILVDMRPLLRNGDYAGAIEQGAGEIIRTITPEPPAAAPRQVAVQVQPEPSWAMAILGFVVFGLILLLAIGLVIVIIRAVMNADWNWSSGTSDDSSSGSSWSSSDSSSSSSAWGSSDSSSSSSSSSSSDFSGGGGSGGGGGASDKW